jgi:hypothetical protein
MIRELREALDVLGRASLTVEGIVDDEINGLAHPILLISYSFAKASPRYSNNGQKKAYIFGLR